MARKLDTCWYCGYRVLSWIRCLCEGHNQMPTTCVQCGAPRHAPNNPMQEPAKPKSRVPGPEDSLVVVCREEFA